MNPNLCKSKDEYPNWKADSIKAQPDSLKAATFLSMSLIGEYESIENTSNKVFKWLDMFAGIDIVLKTKTDEIKGVASRVQYNIAYDTFTVRYERQSGNATEYAKRVSSLNGGSLSPQITMQAYMINGSVVSAAMINTAVLYKFMDENPDKVHTAYSDNEFKFVYWQDIKEAKYPIIIRPL